MSDHAPMLKRLALGSAITVGLLVLLAWGYVSAMDRRMDPTPLAARLDGLPKPDGLILVDEAAIHGSWLIENVAPQASRTYLTPGSVGDLCHQIRQFYTDHGLPTRTPTSSLPSPCVLTIHTEKGTIEVSLREAPAWRCDPGEYPDPMTEVSFVAFR